MSTPNHAQQGVGEGKEDHGHGEQRAERALRGGSGRRQLGARQGGEGEAGAEARGGEPAAELPAEGPQVDRDPCHRQRREQGRDEPHARQDERCPRPLHRRVLRPLGQGSAHGAAAHGRPDLQAPPAVHPGRCVRGPRRRRDQFCRSAPA